MLLAEITQRPTTALQHLYSSLPVECVSINSLLYHTLNTAEPRGIKGELSLSRFL